MYSVTASCISGKPLLQSEIESSKNSIYMKYKYFVTIIFTVTFAQFNASLLNKNNKKHLTDPTFLNGRRTYPLYCALRVNCHKGKLIWLSSQIDTWLKYTVNIPHKYMRRLDWVRERVVRYAIWVENKELVIWSCENKKCIMKKRPTTIQDVTKPSQTTPKRTERGQHTRRGVGGF